MVRIIIHITILIFFAGSTPSLSLSAYTNIFGFTMNTQNLVVVNADRVDFDTMSSYELVVTAADIADSSLTTTAVVNINLMDVNDLSPVVHNDG